MKMHQYTVRASIYVNMPTRACLGCSGPSKCRAPTHYKIASRDNTSDLGLISRLVKVNATTSVG